LRVADLAWVAKRIIVRQRASLDAAKNFNKARPLIEPLAPEDSYVYQSQQAEESIGPLYQKTHFFL
jgi:hypothetical protein